MPALIVIGGGIAGLSTAMLLARDGHQLTVLERDPALPPPPQQAWKSWERRGVNQFRLAAHVHAPLPRAARRGAAGRGGGAGGAGALRFNRMVEMPVAITGGRRRGDERFAQLTGRRPMVEAAIARAAAREPGITIRRGVAVRGLVVDAAVGRPAHVTAVVTDAGELLRSGPRHRRRRASLDAGGVADRGRCAGARRGAGGQRVRVLRPALPLGRRDDAADARTAAAALRVAVAHHATRRQRALVGRHHGERRGPGAAARCATSTCGRRSCAATRSSPTGSTPSRSPAST